jgi:GNAT superfamily N-acetyltransferase
MSIRIETPEGEEALREFLVFHDQVYARRGAAWRAFLPLQLPILSGESPLARERTMRPFLAREDGAIVARAVAAVDHAYNRHWPGEHLGHVDWFEALPETRRATRMLLDAACDWLAAQGMRAARAGLGLLEFPFVVDDHESLPPIGMRQNPAYYHALLKEARFVVEKGAVDYKIVVTPKRIAEWEHALAAARAGGFTIVPFRDVPEERRMREFTDTWNDAFARHWGITPATVEGLSVIFRSLEPAGALDTSVFAYRDGVPLGVVQAAPELSMTAALQPGRMLHPAERMNFLGIGVCAAGRGRGVNLALAAHAFLELARRGAEYVSYTLVLDDNWPSRRTAEKLGAYVCANYVVYRRDLRG